MRAKIKIIKPFKIPGYSIYKVDQEKILPYDGTNVVYYLGCVCSPVIVDPTNYEIIEIWQERKVNRI